VTIEAGFAERLEGIVAVARKLLVALWKYLETEEVPAGAAVRGEAKAGEGMRQAEAGPPV
jgi:hypothetical protein